jgi:HlyD family secretion protein
MRNKWTWIISGVVAVTLAIFGFNSFMGEENTATAETGEIVTVFIGDLAAGATASGQVLPQQEASIAVQSSGTVTEVAVRLGDTVEAGDLLIQLDTADLEIDVANAEQALKIAEANLESLLEDVDPYELAAVQAEVESAQASLDELFDGPTVEELAIAEANVRSAQASYYSASAQYTDVQNSVTEADQWAAIARLEEAQYNLEEIQEITDNFSNQQLHDQLVAAQNAYDEALANYNDVMSGPSSYDVNATAADASASAANVSSKQADLDALLVGPTDQQIANAESTLAQAQLNLENLLTTTSAADLAIAQAEVEQAEISLANAQENLADATISAPFAGLVTAVYVSEGEITNGIVVDLVDTNSFEVVLEVDEVDIGELAVGQPAVVTLEAWSDNNIESEIVRIAPSANMSSDLVTYDVHLSLQTDLPVLVGMTVDANLITANYDDVLLVPNPAIRADRANDRYIVTVVNDETATEVEVTIGLRDEDFTQITSGLAEGDQLLIGNELPIMDLPIGPGN